MDQKLKSEIDNMLMNYEKKNFKIARDLALNITKQLPNDTLAWKILGATYSQIGQLKNSLRANQKVIELTPQDAEAYSNLGVTFEMLERFDEAVENYKKAINLNSEYVMAYNNLGVVLHKLNRLEEAEINYKKSIALKPDYVEAYYNLGNIYLSLEKFEEAIKKYSQALELNPKYKPAQENLISILSYFSPSKEIKNPIVIVNNSIKKIKNNFTLNDGIKKNDLINFFEDSNRIIQDNIKKVSYNKTQIYRTNTTNLNCERHFKVFNKHKIIPKFCFSCFKVQIEPKNVLELINLFFIFDKLKLTHNNIRKCMIEFRPNVVEPYKGLIYCTTMDEANEILQIVSPIINKFIKCKIKIKRGCTEYGEAFPDYKKIDKKSKGFMKYKEVWSEKEKKFDGTQTKAIVNPRVSLEGISVSDFLIMNNWLSYAKMINDFSYKEIYKEVNLSNYISKVISEQLDFRKKNFNNN
ncbi:tetratricopeptide repeat protein [Candidatus Pelagibacter sp. Uisw_113]|uniref:tetratricopeptide repeat protein n=1 Tax=Candidatus Pelagibacter sp. Uisw_113 TaxID=3230994 RepID=UPI0039E84C71